MSNTNEILRQLCLISIQDRLAYNIEQRTGPLVFSPKHEHGYLQLFLLGGGYFELDIYLERNSSGVEFCTLDYENLGSNP